MLYNLHFFSSKCRLFHNATLFGFCITHTSNTGCAKIWRKKIRRQKVNIDNTFYVTPNVAGGAGRRCQPTDAQYYQPLDHQPGRGRSALHCILCTVHRNRLRVAFLAVWRRLVQDRTVPDCSHGLCECVHARADVSGPFPGSRSPDNFNVGKSLDISRLKTTLTNTASHSSCRSKVDG